MSFLLVAAPLTAITNSDIVASDRSLVDTVRRRISVANLPSSADCGNDPVVFLVTSLNGVVPGKNERENGAAFIAFVAALWKSDVFFHDIREASRKSGDDEGGDGWEEDGEMHGGLV